MNRNRIILILVILLAAAALVAFFVTRMDRTAPLAEEAPATNFVCDDGSFYAVTVTEDGIVVADVAYPAPADASGRYESAGSAISYAIAGDTLTAYTAGTDSVIATCSSSVTEIPVDSEVIPGSMDPEIEAEAEGEAEA